MRSGMMYEQGDIVIVPFPFSDLSSIKKRPVLILSKTQENNIFDDIITCGITSHLKRTKYSVLINNDNLEQGNIPKESSIKVDKLFTLNKNIIEKKVAKINPSTLKIVKKEFLSLI